MFIFFKKRFYGYTGPETAEWGGTVIFSILSLLLMWQIVIDFSFPHFSQVFYLFFTRDQPAGHMYRASRFPQTLDRPRLPTTGPPLLGKAPRPDHSSNETAMAVFSHLQRSTVEPSILQESNWTWRPWAHSHRFYTSGTGQAAPRRHNSAIPITTATSTYMCLRLILLVWHPNMTSHLWTVVCVFRNFSKGLTSLKGVS